MFFQLQIDHKSIKNYIDTLRLIKAPKKLFNKPFPTEINFFRVGQKLEGIDPGHETLFCVMTVVEVIGNYFFYDKKFLLLRF